MVLPKADISEPLTNTSLRMAIGIVMRRHWLWTACTLVLLALVALVTPIVYNLGLLLKPEQLSEAQARWQAHGTDSYDLQYQARHNQDAETDEYWGWCATARWCR